MKICKTCGEEKNEFLDFRTQIRKTGREYVDPMCKKCRYANQKEYLKHYTLKCKYNMSAADRELILKSQDGKCKLCGKKFDGKIKINVDHDHKTKVIRGLLCPKCNRGLGQFDDDTRLLEKAIDYLKNANALKELYIQGERI